MEDNDSDNRTSGLLRSGKKSKYNIPQIDIFISRGLASPCLSTSPLSPLCSCRGNFLHGPDGSKVNFLWSVTNHSGTDHGSFNRKLSPAVVPFMDKSLPLPQLQ
jgi:hypothetical protein